jgi:hypothetical protein
MIILAPATEAAEIDWLEERPHGLAIAAASQLSDSVAVNCQLGSREWISRANVHTSI